MALKKIGIGDLRLGMFVSELDISWAKSPFFRHRRIIMQQEDIELLKKSGVETLVIDLAKSKLNMARSSARVVLVAEPVEPAVEPAVPVGPKVALTQELQIAKRIQTEILNTVHQIQNAFEQGKVVDSEAVNPVVEKTLQSIDNNSQAIIALLHEGRDGGKIAMHSFGVFALVLLLTTHLKYNPEEQQLLGLAALIHDAGWTKLPRQLMSKGKAYTPQEKKLVMQHIPIVKQMLASQPDIDPRVVRAIEQHHECLDGSGYPLGLKADVIHSWSRILSTCTEYDEMVHGLGENPGMTPQVALSSLFQLSKKGKLDTFFANHLISLLGVYPIGSAVALDDGRIGVVIETHPQNALRPLLKLFYSAPRKPLPKSMTYDLASETGKIARVLDIYRKDKDLDVNNLLVFTSSMLE